MVKKFVTCLVAGLIFTPAVSMAQTTAITWVDVSFQDAAPFTANGIGSGMPRDLGTAAGAGPCQRGVWWNYERVAPAANNGGYNGRGYMRYTWCDFDVSQAGDQSNQAGFGLSGYRFEPSGTGTQGRNAWPDTFYGRFRIYIERPMIVGAGGDNMLQLKWFIWHGSVYDGDQRVMGFLESGRNCGQSDTTHVCFSIQRNIATTDAAKIALPVGSWQNVQFSWRHGILGTSFVKVWQNNNDAANPTAQNLRLTSVPIQPGNTSEWVKSNVGYDAEFSLGNGANQGTRFSEDFVYRLMDFQLGGAFDPQWATGGGSSTTTPSQPQRLRIVVP